MQICLHYKNRIIGNWEGFLEMNTVEASEGFQSTLRGQDDGRQVLPSQHGAAGSQSPWCWALGETLLMLMSHLCPLSLSALVPPL